MSSGPHTGRGSGPRPRGADGVPSCTSPIRGKGPVSRRCRSRAPGPPSRSIWTRGPGGATSRRARRLLPASCSRRVSPPSFRLFLFSSFPPSLPPPSSSSSFYFSIYVYVRQRAWMACPMPGLRLVVRLPSSTRPRRPVPSCSVRAVQAGGR